MNVVIRRETPEDYAKVAAIIELAFGRKSEAILVENLRRNPFFIPELSLVAETREYIVRHILFSPIKLYLMINSPTHWL